MLKKKKKSNKNKTKKIKKEEKNIKKLASYLTIALIKNTDRSYIYILYILIVTATKMITLH